MELPNSLFCIKLAYILDDRNIVEGLLINFPNETEQCIPIALRQILETNHFFTKCELRHTLAILWQDRNINVKLIHAANRGLDDLVRYLLNRGADIHAVGDDALRSASFNGHTKTARLLLDRNADIRADSDYPLRYASLNDHIGTAKFLIDRKANIHADNDGALSFAAMRGHIDLVKLLLDKNASPNASNNLALRFARRHGHAEIVELLLSRNAVL